VMLLRPATEQRTAMSRRMAGLACAFSFRCVKEILQWC
jgi:hypothetical protein